MHFSTFQRGGGAGEHSLLQHPQRLISCRKLLKGYGLLHIASNFAGSTTLTFACSCMLVVVLRKGSVTLVNTSHAALVNYMHLRLCVVVPLGLKSYNS